VIEQNKRLNQTLPSQVIENNPSPKTGEGMVMSFCRCFFWKLETSFVLLLIFLETWNQKPETPLFSYIRKHGI
jgi:hypothetical protein